MRMTAPGSSSMVTLELTGISRPAGSRTVIRDGDPSVPPIAPRGANCGLVCSEYIVTTDARSSTWYSRRSPRPPLNWPVPCDPGISSVRRTRTE